MKICFQGLFFKANTPVSHLASFQSRFCMLSGLIMVWLFDPFVILIAGCRLMFCKSTSIDVSLLFELYCK